MVVYEKIMVIGPSGAGKSVLLEKLSKIYNIPLYHLDNIWWNEDKTHITREEFDPEFKEWTIHWFDKLYNVKKLLDEIIY